MLRSWISHENYISNQTTSVNYQPTILLFANYIIHKQPSHTFFSITMTLHVRLYIILQRSTSSHMTPIISVNITRAWQTVLFLDSRRNYDIYGLFTKEVLRCWLTHLIITGSMSKEEKYNKCIWWNVLIPVLII